MGLFRMKIGLKIVSGQLFSQFNFKLIQLFDLPTLLEQAFSSLLLPCKRVTVNLGETKNSGFEKRCYCTNLNAFQVKLQTANTAIQPPTYYLINYLIGS